MLKKILYLHIIEELNYKIANSFFYIRKKFDFFIFILIYHNNCKIL